MNQALARLNFHHGPGFDDHGSRVAFLAAATGRIMGLKEHEVDRLHFAALIHDLGKTTIDHHVLGKASPLTEEESIDVREHPQIGHDRIAGMVHPAISESVLCHHESWDGSGYPLGLRKTDIPLMARIVFVADSYDVMTVGRAYRPALGIGQAGERLSASAGRQFDPEVIEAFASIDRRLLQPITHSTSPEQSPVRPVPSPARSLKKHRPYPST